MTRRGRPRRAGARNASGRLKREDERQYVVAQRQRLWGVTAELARTELLGSPWGCLFASKLIREEQRETGDKFSRQYEAYQRAVRSPDSLRASDGAGAGVADDGRDRKAQEQFESAVADLSDFELAAAFAVHERRYGDANLKDLTDCLKKLTAHYAGKR